MIPLRLTLENFMCYREKTEIDFRGSVIWALCGHNGSGKSTIFDAMRYALYGEHREGKQKHEVLIHRGTAPASSLLIEFDFAIGDNEYRVQRTYSQKKKGTMQALYLAGPDAPIPGRPGPQLIPNTIAKDGFNTWVLKTIGLDEQAFTVSVLLLQGQSDKLLKLGGPERHDVLTHIIDLSRYDALAKRALDKQKEQDTFVKSYKGQLDALEQVDENILAIYQQLADEAQKEKERIRQRQLTLAALKEQAQRRLQLQVKVKDLRQELARIESLLEQSEQIESHAARFTVLRQVIQPLTQIQQKQGDCDRLQQCIEQDRKRVMDLEDTILRGQNEWQKAQKELEMIRACHQKKDQEYKAAQAELRKLEIPCNDITHLQQKQKAYQKLVDALSTFAPELEQQQQLLQGRRNKIESIERATPLLKRFADFRYQWQQAMQDMQRISQELSNREMVREQISTQLHALEKDRDEVCKQISQLQSTVTSQKVLFEESQKRSKRFHTIEGGATCSYCGLPLTAEHLETERQHLQEELQERENELVLYTTHYNTALGQQKDVDRDIEQAQQKENQELQARERILLKQNDFARKRDTAYIEAKNQLEQLIPEYLNQIQGTASTSIIHVEACLYATYPTPQDLEMLLVQLREKPALTQELQTVENALSERQELHSKQRYLLGEIEPLLQKYSAEHAASLKEMQKHARRKEIELSDELGKLSYEREQQEQKVSSLVVDERKATEELAPLKQTLSTAEADLKNTRQAITERQERLPVEWHRHIPHLSPEMLSHWQQEMKSLQGAIEKQQDLLEARRCKVQSQQALVDLENEQRQIPEEAWRMPEHVQKEIDQANTSYQEFEQQEQKSRVQGQRLEGVKKIRQELDLRLVEARRLASRYKELSQLLGREGLQHYLLQNAEAGIVNHANETLDRISSGTLRLELRPSSESKTQALDMVVYNSAISARESQSIGLLSGSQQFRVAISLAIGIGQYIGNSNHRVESLMIDEGFGSLDADSRDEMTQALQALEDDFKRVIVVSHQNDFSDKFPNRYEAALVDGCTKISLG